MGINIKYEKKRYKITESRWFIAWISFSFLFFVFLYITFIKPPEEFPIKQLVSIPKGAPVSVIAEQLETGNIVRSRVMFTALTKILGGEKKVAAGDYYFNYTLSLFEVIKRVLAGQYGLDNIKVTIPEGATVKDIGFIIKNKLSDFDKDGFIRLAFKDEGYLFPETYNFLPNYSPRQVINDMRSVFNDKISGIEKEISMSGRKQNDIVIMASLLEKEARTIETKQIIAGILWKRLDDGMLLQVDAVFPYINGKNTFQLSLDDLKIDHPYNTYTRAGLPPGPIANPGLESILAAVTPKETLYWYYLSDKEGNMHYASTFEGHLVNKERYLR